MVTAHITIDGKTSLPIEDKEIRVQVDSDRLPDDTYLNFVFTGEGLIVDRISTLTGETVGRCWADMYEDLCPDEED